jgi:hypothetical protein
MARRASPRRLLHLHRASGCLSTSRGSSRGSSRHSSSTSLPTPRVWVPRHVARLVTRLVAPLLVDFFAYATRSGASARRAAPRAARRRLLQLRRASGCLSRSRRSSSTTPPTPRVRVPRHVAQLVTRLVVDYFNYAACPGASARRVARHVARRTAPRRLLRLRRASGCLSTSHGSSLGSSRRSSSTSSPTPRVRVPRHVARLLVRLVVDYFAYVVHSGASARRTAPRAARRQLLRQCRAFGCLDTSRGSSCDSLSTTSTTSRVRVPRHVARLVTPLVVDYYADVARSGASARRAARRAARHRLLCLRHASGCLGTSLGSSPDSSSTTSTTPRVRVPRHVAWLVTRLVARLVAPLVVAYFDYAARPGASACRAARRAARRRLLHLRRASGCLGTSRGSSSTTSPTLRVWVPRHVARLLVRLVVDYFACIARPGTLLVAQLVVDYFAYAVRSGASAPRAARCRPRAVFAARLLVGRSHRLLSCVGHSISRLGYSSPGCTGSTAYVVHLDAPSSPLDFSSVGRTGSRRAPSHSFSRLGYSPLGCTGSSAPVSCIRTRRLRCSTTRHRLHQQPAQAA